MRDMYGVRGYRIQTVEEGPSLRFPDYLEPTEEEKAEIRAYLQTEECEAFVWMCRYGYESIEPQAKPPKPRKVKPARERKKPGRKPVRGQGTPMEGVEHGRKGYRKGCRCDVCLDDNAARVAEQRARKPKRHPDAAENYALLQQIVKGVA